MDKGKTWIVVIGIVALLEEFKLLVGTCWSVVRSLEQSKWWPIGFSLTALDIVLERVVSLAWVAVVFYWLLRAPGRGRARSNGASAG